MIQNAWIFFKMDLLTSFTFTEPGTVYKIQVTGYQLNKTSEILGPSSTVLEVETESVLNPPQIINLSCVPPDQLFVEWLSDPNHHLHFILRYRAGNTSSTEIKINASLGDWDHHHVRETQIQKSFCSIIPPYFFSSIH